MNFKKNRAKKAVVTFIKCATIFSLLLFFMIKPLLIIELENTDNPIELAQEAEEGNEESEIEYEEDMLEACLFSNIVLGSFSSISNNKYNFFVAQYQNTYTPIINTPPPEIV